MSSAVAASSGAAAREACRAAGDRVSVPAATSHEGREDIPRSRRWAVLLALVSSVFGGVTLPLDAGAQTAGEQTVETRVSVALRVSSAELQKWLPEPWRVQPLASGPSEGANLTLIFVDRLLVLAPDGTPIAGGIDRGLVLSVPSVNTRTGETGSYVVRGLSANAATLPGAYGNYRYVRVLREQSYAARDLAAGTGADRWVIEDPEGGRIQLRLAYELEVPTRSRPEVRVRGGPDPDFYRTYRLDQGIDPVLSVPGGIDRVESFDLEVTIPELAAIFDGSEEVVSVTVSRWYIRDVFLP